METSDFLEFLLEEILYELWLYPLFIQVIYLLYDDSNYAEVT